MDVSTMLFVLLFVAVAGLVLGALAAVLALSALKQKHDSSWMGEFDRIVLGQQGQESAICKLTDRILKLEQR